MNVTLKIDGVDFSEKLSTYKVDQEVYYAKVITALDNTEYASPGNFRPVLTLSWRPLTDEESADLYYALSRFKIDIKYTNPYTNQDVTRKMRLAGNLESSFALTSVDGKRRYIGGNITLRGI